ncbi:NADPH--cytochrome P450 reductase [Mycena chlorophos]|uniref:NADPH--cytochrome P450 reductase n=1 Tax=Mycena chlorophos TaxID=658473 RepID=A0A8H6SD07_MYCCL|nr:NADPH--cytochrome P450 reductase [Mycena chlorophos]
MLLEALPAELLMQLPGYLLSIEDLLTISSLSRKLYHTCANPPPKVLSRLAFNSGRVFFRPHPHLLLALTARELADWAVQSPERRFRLEDTIQRGIMALLELAIEVVGLTMEDIRRLWRFKFDTLNPLDRQLDESMLVYPGSDEAWTMYSDPETVLVSWVIYGELFHHSLELRHRPFTGIRPLSSVTRYKWLVYCVPDTESFETMRFPDYGTVAREYLHDYPAVPDEPQTGLFDATRTLLQAGTWKEALAGTAVYESLTAALRPMFVECVMHSGLQSLDSLVADDHQVAEMIDDFRDLAADLKEAFPGDDLTEQELGLMVASREAHLREQIGDPWLIQAYPNLAQDVVFTLHGNWRGQGEEDALFEAIRSPPHRIATSTPSTPSTVTVFHAIKQTTTTANRETGSGRKPQRGSCEYTLLCNPFLRSNESSKAQAPKRKSLLLRLLVAVFWGTIAFFFANRERAPAPETAPVSESLIENAPFVVAKMPGKGMGLVAVRDIAQGEVLIREAPLFVVPQATTENPSMLVWNLLQGAPPQGQAAFWNLSYVNLPKDVDVERDRDRVALAIFETNAVAAGHDVGIFPRMARLNHGCSSAFNVVYTWRPNEGMLYVHALRDIPTGQELLTTYTDTKRTRAERHAFLVAQYGFQCTCAVCSLDPAESQASDKRLTTIAELYRHFALWGSGGIGGAEAVATIIKIWELEDEEGYWSERGRLAADAAWIAAAHSDAEAVRSWSRLAAKWYTIEVGADSEHTVEVQGVIESPETHRAWSSRETLSVGRPVAVNGSRSRFSPVVPLVPLSVMAAGSSSDVVIIGLGVVLAALYLFRDQLFAPTKPKVVPLPATKAANGSGNPRDFIAKMKEGKKRLVIFYGSQTGTAEEYAIRIAKEAKSKFGLASLVCDPEEYDFENLDQVPDDCAVFFVMATYGEGEPTDNAVTLMQNLTDESFEFSNGSHRLDGLKYVVFALGNKTYEHYNLIGRQVDQLVEKMGGVRIGERGEGDDDKSMEEDYLEWKDGMWEAFATALGVEEGQGADSADFAVSELPNHPPEKVYLGELSARALTRTKGIHDAKNPYPAPLVGYKELFQCTSERNCVHIELNTEGSGITYQHGDHVGVWPTNADVEVDRLLCTLGLWDKKDNTIGIESLDPALAKVPFPVPTTYATVLRHYIDISAVVGRQILSALAKHAPTPEAAAVLQNLSTDKDEYATVVTKGCLKLGEVLQLAAGNDLTVHPTPENTTAWTIPFDIIVSAIPRLQPRYYSISSSPKLHPTSIHVTCVVLKYESVESPKVQPRWVFGVASNFLLNLKFAAAGEDQPLVASGPNPSYAIEGPRGFYRSETIYKAPIHVRRSTFRLPTNPKSPVIMIGPGTGVAPFRGFVQERVALARRTIEKNGPDALADWGQISLFYGCRKSTEDFLYKDEWPEYAEELKGKFKMHTAFSREPPYKPDGSKIYVQDLIWDDREFIGNAILNCKSYIYICGDAKSMSKAVEETLARILGEAKGGSAEVEGAAEVKLLKERSRLMLDVWS